MADNYQTTCRDITMLKERISLVTAPDLNPKQMIDVYDKWASNYETDLSIPGPYPPPRIGADAVADLFGANKDARILDAATGTGLVGFHLHEKGFRNLDGLDPSTGMLQEARNKGVFKKLICDFMGTNTLAIDNGHYDAIVTVGSFTANSHVKHDCFPEMIRITKPGGYFVIVMPEHCLESVPAYRGVLEPAMQSLQKTGKWRLVKRDSFPNTYRDKSAALFVFQIL